MKVSGSFVMFINIDVFVVAVIRVFKTHTEKKKNIVMRCDAESFTEISSEPSQADKPVPSPAWRR